MTLKYTIGEMVRIKNDTIIPSMVRGKEATITSVNDSIQVYYAQVDGEDDVTILPDWIKDRGVHKAVQNLPITVDNDKRPQLRHATMPVNQFGKPLYMIDGKYYELANWGEPLSDGSRWAGLREVQL